LQKRKYTLLKIVVIFLTLGYFQSVFSMSDEKPYGVSEMCWWLEELSLLKSERETMVDLSQKLELSKSSQQYTQDVEKISGFSGFLWERIQKDTSSSKLYDPRRYTLKKVYDPKNYTRKYDPKRYTS